MIKVLNRINHHEIDVVVLRIGRRIPATSHRTMHHRPGGDTAVANLHPTSPLTVVPPPIFRLPPRISPARLLAVDTTPHPPTLEVHIMEEVVGTGCPDPRAQGRTMTDRRSGVDMTMPVVEAIVAEDVRD